MVEDIYYYSRPANKRHVIAHAHLFTHLMNARRAIHRTPKIYNFSLLVFPSSDFLLFENMSSCFFSFRISGKTCSCRSLWKISCYTRGNQEIFFSCPSKVEVVIKNELYHVKKNPFKCIKNNYFCWKQSRLKSPHAIACLGQPKWMNDHTPTYFFYWQACYSIFSCTPIVTFW